MIRDFPESRAAMAELRAVMHRVPLHAVLTASLGAQIDRRVLHPGAETKAILDFFVNATKVWERACVYPLLVCLPPSRCCV